MPALNVFGTDGGLAPNAHVFIRATMLVPGGPEDDSWHLHIAAQEVEAALASNADGLTLDRAAFNRLYKAGRAFVEGEQRRRWRDGEQAGEILLIIRTLARERPKVASLGNAMRLHAESMTQFTETKLLRAASKLRAAWSEFEPVAHLWAAHRLLCRSEDYGIGAPVDWRVLLALADRFRRWAERHHSPTGSTGAGRLAAPLFAPGAAWRAPVHAVLPHDEAARLDRLVLGQRAEEMITSTPV